VEAGGERWGWEKEKLASEEEEEGERVLEKGDDGPVKGCWQCAG